MMRRTLTVIVLAIALATVMISPALFPSAAAGTETADFTPVAFAYLPFVAKGSPDSGWYQFGHDSSRTGYTPDPGPENPDYAWSTVLPLSYRPWHMAHLIATDELLVLPTIRDGVFALDQATGQVVWVNVAVQSRASAAYDPVLDVLYVSGTDGVLYQLDRRTGDVIRSFQADGALYVAPLLVGSTVVVGSEAGTLYALDGGLDVLWEYSAGSPIDTTASYSPSRNVVVMCTEDLHVHAVRFVDGVRAWRVKPTPNSPGGSHTFERSWPVVWEGRGVVFVKLRPSFDGIRDPDGGWPGSNEAGRQHLVANPHLKSLFALSLDSGAEEFVANVGPGGMEYEWGFGFRIDNGPLPAVVEDRAYTIWRSHQKVDAGYAIGFRRDSVLGEMDGDGDMRFIEVELHGLSSDGGGLLTDEQPPAITVYGPPENPDIAYPHWIASHVWEVSDRSPGVGGSFVNPMPTEHVLTVVMNMNSCGGGQDPSRHFCAGMASGDGRTRSYYGGSYYIYYNASGGPPRVDPEGPGTPLHWMAVNGRLFLLDDRGAVIAFADATEP